MPIADVVAEMQQEPCRALPRLRFYRGLLPEMVSNLGTQLERLECRF